MSIFKHSRKYGTVLLAAWLIASGLIHVLHLGIPYSGGMLSLLGIAAGVLILMDR